MIQDFFVKKFRLHGQFAAGEKYVLVAVSPPGKRLALVLLCHPGWLTYV
jgi:hypothetical protein